MAAGDTDNSTGAARRVQRRRVLYLPGYDPFPPRRYRELYRRESAKQAALSGYEIAVARAEGDGPFGWHVRAEMDGQAVETDYRVLIWSDIVRQSMTMGVAATYLLLVQTFWRYLSCGAMVRLFRLRAGPVIAGLYPVAILLGQLGLALGAGWAVFRLGGWGLAGLMPDAAARGLAAAAGVLVVAPILWWFKRIDGKLYAYYLLHDYAFTARFGGANPPALEARIAEFVAELQAALDDPTLDEVLVIGHSSGAHLAISVVADALRAGGPRPGGAVLGLLTLGQAVPMQSFLPGATRIRADLVYLATSPALSWIDVSAPGDGCCYALCDPVAVTGVAPAEGKRWPLVISAAFSRSLKPETWKRLRRRYFRLHFQYLCAFDGTTDYDYFRITAGPDTLGARFAHRSPSASRIETPMSPHISTEAAA